MSYCRFNTDCAVYVYEDKSIGGITCGTCLLRPIPDSRSDAPPETDFKNLNVCTPAEMIKHLAEHLEAGHRVPPDVFQCLAEDAQQKRCHLCIQKINDGNHRIVAQPGVTKCGRCSGVVCEDHYFPCESCDVNFCVDCLSHHDLECK